MSKLLSKNGKIALVLLAFFITAGIWTARSHSLQNKCFEKVLNFIDTPSTAKLVGIDEIKKITIGGVSWSIGRLDFDKENNFGAQVRSAYACYSFDGNKVIAVPAPRDWVMDSMSSFKGLCEADALINMYASDKFPVRVYEKTAIDTYGYFLMFVTAQSKDGTAYGSYSCKVNVLDGNVITAAEPPFVDIKSL